MSQIITNLPKLNNHSKNSSKLGLTRTKSVRKELDILKIYGSAANSILSLKTRGSEISLNSNA